MYQLIFLILPIVFLLDSRNLRKTGQAFVFTALGFALSVLPWSAYVTAQTGHFILLSANGGETLSGGFNDRIIELENTTLDLEKRTAWTGPGKWIPINQNGYLNGNELELPYDQQDAILQKRTLAWLIGNPDRAAYLAMRKVAYMWGYYPWEKNGWAQIVFGNIPVIFLQLFCLAAIVRSPLIRRQCARFYLLPLFVTGVALISWGSWRFRQPADAGLIAIAAIAATQIYARRSPGRQPL